MQYARANVRVVLFLGAAIMATTAHAQWIACTNASVTCTTQQVGIGTTSPSRNLVVSGSTATLQLSTLGSGATCCDGFQLQQLGNDTNLINEQSGNMAFWTSARKRMTLDANGNLGIGKVPGGSYALDVSGVVSIQQPTNPNGVGTTLTINAIAAGIVSTCNPSVFGPGYACQAINASASGDGPSQLNGAYGVRASGGTGRGGTGVYGEADGLDSIGVYGLSQGSNGVALFGYGTNSATGVFAYSPGGLAGSFRGNVQVTGSLSKGGGSFKIDHPLDPADKYLYHSFVESPDMKNIYDGVALLDGQGEVVVQLPEWFEALNQDFRYQLTSIGAPGPNLYIADEVHGNQFRIAGGKPGAKVSWQVTGTRHDAWANAHRIPVEEDKPEAQRGRYLYPAEQGQPEKLAIDWEMISAVDQKAREQQR